MDAYFKAARGAFSPNTERALRSDVQVFRTWCREQVLTAFPAGAATVAAFIDEMGRIKTPATVRRCVSSIATVHKALQETNPVDSAAVRFALQRMHRRRGRRQAQVQGLTWPLRNRLIDATGDRLIDARDRALLAVGYDTLLRRAELVSVKVADLLEEIDGTATLLVRSGKTDREGRGTTLYLARDTVALVKTWREVGRIDAGYLFRSVRKDATVGEKLDASQVPAHLQEDGATRWYSRRRRGHPGRAQHPGRGCTGHDRLRNRAARHPPVRTLEDDPDGPPLRGAVARATQRRRPAGRAAEPVRETTPATTKARNRASRTAPRQPMGPGQDLEPQPQRDVIASKTAGISATKGRMTAGRPAGVRGAHPSERPEPPIFGRIRSGQGHQDPEQGGKTRMRP